MARQLTPLGIAVIGTAKWVVLPLVLALIGYILIGPNIGSKTETKPAAAKRSSELSKQGQKFQSVRENNR